MVKIKGGIKQVARKKPKNWERDIGLPTFSPFSFSNRILSKN